jgi:hypothetical protein
MPSIKIREDRIRRRLAKFGYHLNKTPSRSWLRKHHGPGYTVTRDNTVVLGCEGREFSAKLDEVETFAFENY